MEQLTTENAPLFLALEITKKTAKMVYVDTPDHSAEKIFRRQGLTFKRLNERTSDDSRYIFVGCRISRRDTEVFRKAIEELEEVLVQEGYEDYRAWSLAALIELVEDEVNAAGGFGRGMDDAAGSSMQEGMSEYPKSTFVPFIPADSLPDSLLACYALTRTGADSAEVMIFNSHPKEQEDGYLLPSDAFALVLRKETPISFEIFRKTYLKHKSGLTGLACLDPEGKKKISIHMLPEETYQAQNLPRTPVITIYDRETEAVLPGFLQKWDEKYQELRK